MTPDKGETRLQKVPVYYLTSRRSASAAEHLALAFKRTHRATLVGETTRARATMAGSLRSATASAPSSPSAAPTTPTPTGTGKARASPPTSPFPPTRPWTRP
uniref:Tail specific protease domain-containing protein n=1 Tax=Phenylobacterium glaciei TaxID=2803784 RepID=A0A974P2J7_9CAUL|nr:hypothetical protein JKL49_21835 [Phenylobacterium glaciei]